jgi:hypothetical protein
MTDRSKEELVNYELEEKNEASSDFDIISLDITLLSLIKTE